MWGVLSAICSPHNFIAKCVEKRVSASFYYFYGIVGFPDGQSGTFFASFTSSVNSYQKVVASAFYIKRNFPIISDNDGTGIETMWSYSSNRNCSALGN